MADTVTPLLASFAAELRGAGLVVGSGDVLTYCAALARLDPADLVDVYWSGRCALVHRADDIGVYDEVFERFFLGGQEAAQASLTMTAVAATEAALADQAAERPDAEPSGDAVLGWMASGAEVLRRKSFPSCTPEELAALRRIMTRMRLVPPLRRTRRHAPARSGRRPDVRATIRESMRMAGEPGPLRWRARRVRPRPLVLLLDISGSMADYSRALVQFAYSARASHGRVEVFCFGTRLTRITGSLAGREPDGAIETAAATAFDWDAGTRIGSSLETFVSHWARRGLCRGGIVVICSDGLDRDDPRVLAAAMERLSRLCFRVVWVNPHAGKGPPPVGLTAALPHTDLMLPGHDLRSLERLAVLLPDLR
jgi:uncharacterized protein with von Willebrand factor type A (vWA) domain